LDRLALGGSGLAKLPTNPEDKMKRTQAISMSITKIKLPVQALAALALLSISIGCVSQAPSVDVAPGSQQNPNASGTIPGNGFDQTMDTGSLSAVLDERQLKDQFNINTANLSYRFTYLGKSESGAIRFSGGKSRVSLSKLKPGQTGTVSLEISEGNVLRLKGEQANVTLRPGQNEMSLNLRSVAPLIPGPGTNPGTGPGTNPGTGPGTNPGANNNGIAPPQDTSLSINVTMDGNNPSPPAQPNVQPNVQPNIQPNVTPQIQPQAWNGIGDRGNENWSIESVE
jgi:hypothetical protein